MAACEIKNVVFDIGNVLVRWSPVEIVKLTFGDSSEAEEFSKSLFQSDLWLSLNKGEMTELEAKERFRQRFNLSTQDTEQLFYYVKQSLILLYGSSELLARIKKAGYKTFALTDNVVEIVAFLKEQYQFWPLFDGAIVSADVGCLKPHPGIFNHLLNDYDIQAHESVFLDDVLANVEGAQKLGFKTVHFKNAIECEKELIALGLAF